MGVCNCSMFCCTLLYVHSSIAIILMGKRELVALLNLSSWCLLMVERLFLVVPCGCLQFVIVVFPDHTHLLFLCCYFHRGYRITNLILKLPHNHYADILNPFVKPGINIYNKFNNIYSFNKSLTHHSNKYISGLQIL